MFLYLFLMDSDSPSYQKYVMLNNHGAIVSNDSLLPFSALSYILVPVFFSALLLVCLLLCFFHSFGPLRNRECLGILYMWCCFSIYIKIWVPVHSFLVLRMNHMLLHALILLVMYWRCLCIFVHLLCVCCWVLLVSLGKLYNWQP